MELAIEKRNRKLRAGDDVFAHNAWDDIDWTDEMLRQANQRIQEQIEEHKNLNFNLDQLKQVESNVLNKWDAFYKAHGDKFFKDRRWIKSEFPEIFLKLKADSFECRIFEVGCGVGNCLTQILESNLNRNLHVYCCDLSQNAIETLMQRDIYINSTKVTAFQADLCKDFESKISPMISKGSIDMIMLVFTLSALKPESMKAAIKNLVSLLKPGGTLFFRDYAQYDLSQLRFKGRSYLAENYYVRSDGTTSYFFTKEIVDDLFTSAGLEKLELKDDNRLLVNRLKSITMCRCWIQAKYRKT